MTRRLPTDQRRLQIADAALKVIAQQGLGRFTTQAIAAEVGITDGTLFRHFTSKEEIVLAALDRVEVKLFEGFPPTDAQPLARLERLFRLRAALVWDNPVIAALAFSEELPHAAGEAGARQVTGWKRRTVEFIHTCLTDAQEQGQLVPGLAPGDVSIIVVGTLMALVKLGPIAGGPDAVDRTWAVLSRLFRADPS